jgi:hypothetical protein
LITFRITALVQGGGSEEGVTEYDVKFECPFSWASFLDSDRLTLRGYSEDEFSIAYSEASFAFPDGTT